MQSAGASTANGIISLTELIDFLAHVADCYKDLTAEFPEELMVMLQTHHASLESELREKLVSSLVLLRKKEIIDSSKCVLHSKVLILILIRYSLLHTLFPILTSTPSKTLRALLFQKILSDLRSSNSKGTNHRLNRTLQTVLYNLLVADRASPKGLWAVKLTRELWKRQIWTDSKAVEIMKEASLAENPKVLIGGVRFFLGGDKEREELEDESSDEEEIDMGKIKHQVGINKKTKKKSKQLDKAVAQIKKVWLGSA
jgi:protein SDA1